MVELKPISHSSYYNNEMFGVVSYSKRRHRWRYGQQEGERSGRVNDLRRMVMSEKVCKILLRPSPPAWGTPSRRGICDVDFSLSFYLIFHSRKYGSRLAYVPSVFSLATEPKR